MPRPEPGRSRAPHVPGWEGYPAASAVAGEPLWTYRWRGTEQASAFDHRFTYGVKTLDLGSILGHCSSPDQLLAWRHLKNPALGKRVQ